MKLSSNTDVSCEHKDSAVSFMVEISAIQSKEPDGLVGIPVQAEASC